MNTAPPEDRNRFHWHLVQRALITIEALQDILAKAARQQRAARMGFRIRALWLRKHDVDDPYGPLEGTLGRDGINMTGQIDTHLF